MGDFADEDLDEHLRDIAVELGDEFHHLLFVGLFDNDHQRIGLGIGDDVGLAEEIGGWRWWCHRFGCCPVRRPAPPGRAALAVLLAAARSAGAWPPVEPPRPPVEVLNGVNPVTLRLEVPDDPGTPKRALRMPATLTASAFFRG